MSESVTDVIEVSEIVSDPRQIAFKETPALACASLPGLSDNTVSELLIAKAS